MTDLLHTALIALEEGLCVIPAARDGTKAPHPGGPVWGHYQTRRPTIKQLEGWLADGYSGIGLVCGAVSGGLEMLEFEGRAIDAGLLEEFDTAAQAAGIWHIVKRLADGYCEHTPAGGIHLLYRCAVVEKNLKLAMRPGPGDTVEVLIETRGEGGFTIIAPSNGTTHENGGSWELAAGNLRTIPTLTVEERKAILDLARTFDLIPAKPAQTPPPTPNIGFWNQWQHNDRPGDDYNARTTWAEVLEPAGWVHVFDRGAIGYWRRPGKALGVSATTNSLGTDRLKVFSTSTVLDTEGTHDRFSVYTKLHHHGDFGVSARELRAETHPSGQTKAHNPASDTTTTEPSGWEPVDLRPILDGQYDDRPTMGARTDGVCLLYPGRVHALNGEPECGKSWFAQALTRERIQAGQNVLYLDFEDCAGSVVERLVALGITADEILRHFVYIAPSVPWSLEAALNLMRTVEAYKPVLVVIDGVTEGMALFELSPYENTDVAKWWAAIPRPMARAGAAVTILDHVVKDREGRGRWALGAQHKLAAVDGAAYSLDIVKPFGRGIEGIAKITVTKDRPGHIRRHAPQGVVGQFHLTSWPDDRVDARLDPPTGFTDDGFRPTVLMEKASRYVESHPGISKRSITAAVSGDDKVLRLAIELLVLEDYFELDKQGSTHCLTSLKPYRNEEVSLS